MGEQPVSVEVLGADELRSYLDQLPKQAFENTKKSFASVAAEAHRAVSNRVRDGAGDTLHSRSGQLRRSLKYKVFGDDLDSLGASVYSEKSIAPYALLHEYGGDIKAKNAYHGVPGGPYLNIPSDENKTPAGVPRLSAREVFGSGGYVRQIGNGRYAVFREDVPMFWLVREVTIPARLKMVETVGREVTTLMTLLTQSTEDAIK